MRLTGNRGTSKSDGMDRGQHPFVDYAERENKDAGADDSERCRDRGNDGEICLMCTDHRQRSMRV